LVITEIMPAPLEGNGGPGEWFEVLANSDVDLNGLTLANEGAGTTELMARECLAVRSGDWLLFARSADADENGGLPFVTALFEFGLADSGSSAHPERAVVLSSAWGELDREEWVRSTKGVSWQRSSSALPMGSADSALSPYWCLTPEVASSAARATPGQPNLQCPEP
jgi:hypothetical protein